MYQTSSSQANVPDVLESLSDSPWSESLLLELWEAGENPTDEYCPSCLDHLVWRRLGNPTDEYGYCHLLSTLFVGCWVIPLLSIYTLTS